MTDLISYAVGDSVAHIELNRPEVSNAIDLPTAHALSAAIKSAATDDDVRAVLVTGAGKRFCAGGDVASMIASDGDQSAYLLELAGALDGALQELTALEKPVVGAVQGAVAGAGLAVMLSCDLVVAEVGTKFVAAYPGVGLTPDCGVSWLLPRAIGQQRALHLALTNKPVDSDVALDWGLVTEIGDASRAADLAASLAAGPVFAYGQARRLIRNSFEVTRAESGADEAKTIGRAVATDDAGSLIQAFANR